MTTPDLNHLVNIIIDSLNREERIVVLERSLKDVESIAEAIDYIPSFRVCTIKLLVNNKQVYVVSESIPKNLQDDDLLERICLINLLKDLADNGLENIAPEQS